mgnify:CR=1 FL=1
MKRAGTHIVAPDDALLSGIHLSFIAFSYAFALAIPGYWGAAMIIAHAAHERIVGDCLLSRIQKRRGYSGPDDDFFYHLFSRLGAVPDRKVTHRIHAFIKTTILIIVLAKAAARYV